MSVISISNLQFAYKRKHPILRQLSMEVPKGSIYGFLGANGAGKSTTIRNILGLLKPQPGAIQVLGHEVATAGSELYRKVGSLIESPSYYSHLTGEEHLRISSHYLGRNARKNIGGILEKVGLVAARHKKVGQYSTGMKQRLGLGMALIHDPELLLLDEPTNGLDPTGIREIRQIIQALQQEGKTILLSSHLLSEVERIVTHLGILRDGKMVFEGSLETLAQEGIFQPQLEVETSDAAALVAALPELKVLQQSEGRLQLAIADRSQVPALIRRLAATGIDLFACRVLTSDLEKSFLHLTEEEQRK
ncbi:MAG: ATP-binding cassette domain-containing protein [Bacteroidota bacterium]